MASDWKRDELKGPLAARVRQEAQGSVGQLLFICARLWDERAQGRVNRRSGRLIMRPAYARLLPHLGSDGVRLTDLAERVDVSKQAVGKTIAEMEADGIVELLPDPEDGRAKRVRLTRKGQQAILQGLEVLREIEGELAAQLGAAEIDQLRGTLQRLLPLLRGGG